MRHNKSFNHLSRTSSHRSAMLSNMASSLILHKRINTTLAKAKALRVYVEPLLTKAKNDTTHSRRVVFSMLQDKVAVTELFREISVKIANRPGGYTRIIKLGTRLGDNADMAMIELVDYNENLLGDKGSKKAKSTRRRRSTKKTTHTEAKQSETEKAEVESKETAVEPEAEEVKAKETEEFKAEETQEPKVKETEEVKPKKAEVKAEETEDAEIKDDSVNKAEEKSEDLPKDKVE